MKEVNILIGRFQPLTKGHIKCIEYAWDKYKIPTVLCVIETKKLDERKPFPSDLLVGIYKDLKINHLEDIITIEKANLPKIALILKDKNMIIRTWTCGTDRYDAYNSWVSRYADALSPDFQLVEIKRSDEDESATKAREAIKNNNLREFLKLFPKCSISFGTRVFEELKKYITQPS